MITYDINKAADALRRHEQAGKNLNEWDKISAAQRRKWRDKVRVAVNAGFDGKAVPAIAQEGTAP